MLPISLLERPTNICRTGCTVEFSEDMTFALWTSQIWGRPHRNLRGGQRVPRCRRPRGRGGHPWWPFRRGDAERREASGARGSQPDSPRLRAARAGEEPRVRHPPPASRLRSATPGPLRRGASATSPSHEAGGRAGPGGPEQRGARPRGGAAAPRPPGVEPGGTAGQRRHFPWGRGSPQQHGRGQLSRSEMMDALPARGCPEDCYFRKVRGGRSPGVRWAPELPAPSRSQAVPPPPGPGSRAPPHEEPGSAWRLFCLSVPSFCRSRSVSALALE